MKRRFSGPQIVAKLRQADVLIGQGKVCKEISLSQSSLSKKSRKNGRASFLAQESGDFEKSRSLRIIIID